MLLYIIIVIYRTHLHNEKAHVIKTDTFDNPNQKIQKHTNKLPAELLKFYVK